MHTHLKELAAQAALMHLASNTIIGVGTGSTVDIFIEAMAKAKMPIEAAVASSDRTEQKLRSYGIPVTTLSEHPTLAIYFDGADEIVLSNGYMIKGGGGALTREKIVASAAKQFICMVDETKVVTTLGQFPLPIEIIPMAYNIIVNAIEEIGGSAKRRANFITDNGNWIIDVSNLTIENPLELEQIINQWPGVVTVGLFTKQHAHTALVGTKQGLKKVTI